MAKKHAPVAHALRKLSTVSAERKEELAALSVRDDTGKALIALLHDAPDAVAAIQEARRERRHITDGS